MLRNKIFHSEPSKGVNLGCLQSAELADEYGVKDGHGVLYAGKEASKCDFRRQFDQVSRE
jgi:hypothetical protein